MLVEIAGDEMFFQAISRTGATVDRGTIRRQMGDSAAKVSAPPKRPGRRPAAPAPKKP